MPSIALAASLLALAGPGGDWEKSDFPRSLSEEVRSAAPGNSLSAALDPESSLLPSPFSEKSLLLNLSLPDFKEEARQDTQNPQNPPRGPADRPPTLPPAEKPPREEDYIHPHRSPGDAFETHFSAKAWRDYVWDDYLTTPKVLLPALFAVSAATISHWDKPLQRHWFGVLGNRGWYSDAGQYTLLGAVIVDGLLLPGEGRNWWDEAWTIGEAYAASSLTTYVLKTEVQRPRPSSVSGTGIGTHSFPSGHSQSAFTAATLIEANSGPLFGLPAYGLAGFTAFERVEEGRHYPSDILAGAAIGTLSAGIFDALHWGTGTQGGIARPPMKLALDMDGLKGFTLSATIGF